MYRIPARLRSVRAQAGMGRRRDLPSPTRGSAEPGRRQSAQAAVNRACCKSAMASASPRFYDPRKANSKRIIDHHGMIQALYVRPRSAVVVQTICGRNSGETRIMLFFMGFLGEKKILRMATVLINAFQFTIILNLGYCISMCLDGG